MHERAVFFSFVYRALAFSEFDKESMYMNVRRSEPYRMCYRGKTRNTQKGRVQGMTSPSRVYPVRIKWSNGATASP